MLECPQQTEIVPPNGADETLFTLEYLFGLKIFQHDKQPGPGHLHMELLKWLSHENRKVLMNLILTNMWWYEKTAPHALQARVVPICKKGETDDEANYLPISELSSTYKVYII